MAIWSRPYQLVHEQVEVRYTVATVEVIFKGRRVASHPRRHDRRVSTVAEHMPSAHRAHAEWTPSRLIGWAEKVGPATAQLVTRMVSLAATTTKSASSPRTAARVESEVTIANRMRGIDRSTSLRSDERSTSPKFVFHIPEIGVPLHRNTHLAWQPGIVRGSPTDRRPA